MQLLLFYFVGTDMGCSLEEGTTMPNKQRDGFGFAIRLWRALTIVAFFGVTLLAAEVYLTKGHMLAEAEIANGCSPCGASMALATQNNVRVPH
jgi:uncharacterized membrane protein YadS